MSRDTKSYKCPIAHQTMIRLIGLALFAMGLFAATGCGSSNNADRLPVFPTSGTVSIDGQAPTGAFVVLHPKADYQRSPDGELVRPHGLVRGDGTFELTSYSSNDGAPTGEYIVTLELRKVVQYSGGDAGPGPNLIPAKFAKPNTSPVIVRIEAGTNRLPPISLSIPRSEKQLTATRYSPTGSRGL
jgi:hypothetical protein